MKTKIILAILVLLVFWIAAALCNPGPGYGRDYQVPVHLLLCKHDKKAPRPKFDKKANVWRCPAGWTVTAGEADLVAGRPFVACSK